MKPLVILVTGQRVWDDVTLITQALNHYRPYTVIEGEARGADVLARAWAEATKTHFVPMPADWQTLGKSAGPQRNIAMLDLLAHYRTLDHATLVVGFLDEARYGESKGTKHCLGEARRRLFPTQIVNARTILGILVATQLKGRPHVASHLGNQ